MKPYGLDYVAGTAARKLYYEEQEEKQRVVKRSVKQSQKKVEMTLKSKVSLILSVLTVFSAFMIIIYRSNMISEANLKVIKLKSELADVTSDLSLAMMNIEQGQNLSYIEAYAKQKLGMQKPDKNQIIYVDTSTVEKVDVVGSNNDANRVLDSIKKFFNIK